SVIANSTACRHLAMLQLLVRSVQTGNPPRGRQFQDRSFHGIGRLGMMGRREVRTMIMRDLDGPAARLREMIEAAEAIVPFTGAGISTECGIPDFRSPGGIWTKYQPIPFDEFLASQEARSESWRRRFAMHEQLSSAQPGRGHRALASLYRAGKV